MTEVKRRIRCAVYTRKSTEEGLEQEFNSLDAQREAGEAYVTSQRSEGWILVPDYYDDGGISGGTLERPALQRLLNDVKNGLVDVIVVYKVDRLSRSLMDFAKLVTVFDEYKVSFVSVTQQFNTTTSMGRLTLNILLSFAQFEREVIGERIRDKFAASKKKGMWMGGSPPLGYDVVNRKLIVNQNEVELVRSMFSHYIEHNSVTKLAHDLRVKGVMTKSFITTKGKLHEGTPVSKTYVYRILSNPVYIGQISHKKTVYPGQHNGIISQEVWDQVRAKIAISPRERTKEKIGKTPAILKGLANCGGCNSIMSPTCTRKKGKLYRYYAGSKYLTLKCTDCPLQRVPAQELEQVVMQQIKPMLVSPDVIVKTWLAAKEIDPSITETQVRDALRDTDVVWNELFPAEQQRLIQLIVDSITVYKTKIDIKVKTGGLSMMASEIMNARISKKEITNA